VIRPAVEDLLQEDDGAGGEAAPEEAVRLGEARADLLRRLHGPGAGPIPGARGGRGREGGGEGHEEGGAARHTSLQRFRRSHSAARSSVSSVGDHHASESGSGRVSTGTR
jgi:hypothetical protein